MMCSPMTPEQQLLLLQHQQLASNPIFVKNTFLHVEGDDEAGSLAQQSNASRRQQSEPPQMRQLNGPQSGNAALLPQMRQWNGFHSGTVESVPKFPDSPELYHRQIMPMGLGPVYETIQGAQVPSVAAQSFGGRVGVTPGSFPQLQMDGANVMTMPVDTGGNNIVSAAVVPCNGGYAIPVVPFNGGYCIPAVTVNGQGPGSRTVCGGMEASQAPCPNDMRRLGANAQSTTNGQDEDDMINEIDLTFGNKFRQGSVGNRQTSSPASAVTESTWLPSENSRQISAVSDASWSSSARFGSNFHQTAWAKDGPTQQKGRDGDQWTTNTVTKEQTGFDSISTTAPYGGHHNQMPEQVQNMLLQRSQGVQGLDTSSWNMESSSNGRLPLPPGMLQEPQVADTGSTPEGPFFNSGAGQSQAQLAQIVELFGALKGNRAVQKQMPRSAQKEKSSKQAAYDPMSWDAGVVTVMIRQVPRQYSQLMLLKEVNQRGFEGLYDFLYLPFDLKKGINVGYGFVSFVHPQHALEFRKAFEGTFLDSHSHSNTRGKPVHVHPASLQGYEANCSHFMTTKTGQKQDPQFSPLFFPQGQPVDAATASQLGGGFFAAHQAALVSQQEQKLNEGSARK